MRRLQVVAVLSVVAMLLTGARPGETQAPKQPYRIQSTAVVPVGVSAPSGNTGVVEGTVLFSGSVPKRKPLRIETEEEVCLAKPHFDERLIVSPKREVQNVVVSLENPPPGSDPAALGSEFAIHQRNCTFVPHVVLVPVGVPLKVYNHDGILHNFHALGKRNRPFNLAQPKHRKVLQRKFRRPEIVPIKCDVHRWMKAYVVVVDHPFHAITDEEGHFRIEGLPPGRYGLHFWHETLGELEKQVTVTAEQVTRIKVTYPAVTEPSY